MIRLFVFFLAVLLDIALVGYLISDFLENLGEYGCENREHSNTGRDCQDEADLQ